MNNRTTSAFYQRLWSTIGQLGGMFNAHLHLDRAGTLEEKYLGDLEHPILEYSHVSLLEKHALIRNLHGGPAYQPDDLAARVNAHLDIMVSANTFRADTLVDVTDDNVGLSALGVMKEIKASRASDIELMIGAYSPLGFTDNETRAWDLFVEGAEQSDFMATLPEADDIEDYPGHIGFYKNCKRGLLLSQRLDKMIHIHVDQRNEQSECGTEQLIEAVREFGAPSTASGEPMVWAIHIISPSTYDEARFNKLVEGLVECNIGVICCPSAAIGMRQIRPLSSPTYNSIPRVLEMAAAGVHVRLGSDNIADICSPSTTADLNDEIYILSAALRFYNPEILARFGAGMMLSTEEQHYVKHHLQQNDLEMEKLAGGRD